MRNYILLTITLLNFSIFAQEPDSKDSTDRYLNNVSKIEKIDRLRSLMIDAIIEEDYQKIGKYVSELRAMEGNRYIGLFPYELMALKYLTFEFEEVLQLTSYLDTVSHTTNYKITPTTNRLSYVLRDELLNRKTSTIKTIKNSQLSDEKKQVLEIQHILLIANADTSITQDSLNYLSKVFLDQNPNSKFRDFVIKNAYFEYVESNWGLGLDFFMGYGTFDRDLGRQFGDVFSIGLAFDVQYKSIILYLRNYIGFSSTKQDIKFEEDVWKSGETSLVFLPEASIGFQLFENNKIKLSPFAGISSLDISPTLDKSGAEEYDKLTLGFTSAPCVGFNFDIKLHQVFNFVSVKKPEQSRAILRFRYSYHDPNYSSRFDGGIHSFVIGYGGFGRTLKRVQPD